MRLERIRVATAAALLALLPVAAQAVPMLQPKRLEHDNYAETWTFVADLDGGAYAQIQLSLTNLGPGGNHGICRALLVEPGEKPWEAGERFLGKGARHQTSGETELLQIGTCRIRRSPGSMQVTAQFGGRELRLDYPSPPQPITPPGNELRIGDRIHVTEILVPGARVQGQVRARGEKPRKLAGGGYADHSFSTTEPKELARRWVRFRAVRPDRPTLLLLGREAIDGSFAPLWLRRPDGSFESFDRFAFERTGGDGNAAFRVSVRGNRQLEIRSESLLFRHAPVEELGVFAGVVRPFAGSPVTYTFRARLRGAGDESIPGILEVSLAEE